MAPADGNIAPDGDASFWPWVGLGIGLCCLLLLIVLVVVLLRRRKAKAKEDLGDHDLSRVSGTPATGTTEYASASAFLQADEDEDKSVVYALMPENTESNRSLPDKVVYASFPETQPISEVTYAYGMLE
jgi:flagellar biosynthesis/type III secretory pathway M-ring protein FliF/YscJ